MSRSITPTESLYLTIEKSLGPFSILRVIRGSFSDQNSILLTIRGAWDFATRYHPNFRLVLRGNIWVENEKGWHAPINVEHRNIDLGEVPYLTSLDSYESNVRLWVFQDALVFQASHAITDGVGIQRLIERFFDRMKMSFGEDLNLSLKDLSNNSNLNHCTERQIASKFRIKPRFFIHKIDQYFNRKSIINTEIISNHAAWNYKQIRLENVLHDEGVDKLLPILMLKISHWLRSLHPKNTIRFMLPVDLRKYDNTLEMDGNLSLPLWFDLNGDEGVTELSEDIRFKIKNKVVLRNADPWWLSGKLLSKIRNFVFVQLVNRCSKRDCFPVSVVISFLGKYNVENYHFPGFKCESVWSTALFSGIAPIQIHVTYDEENLQLHLSYYKQYFTQNDISALFTGLSSPPVNQG